MTSSVQWAAQLNGVREVTLRGKADLTYWQDRLRPHGMIPTNVNGFASVVVVSAAGRFAAMKFQEMSISVSVDSPTDGADLPSLFLDSAFNSSRLFAWCERTLFATPYLHAKVDVTCNVPASIQVTDHGNTLFAASMQREPKSPARVPAKEIDESWVAKVFLPCPPNARAEKHRLFLARIRGTTQIYPFLTGLDSLLVDTTGLSRIPNPLAESRFLPLEWIVRTNASHAKSKTYSMRQFANITETATA